MTGVLGRLGRLSLGLAVALVCVAILWPTLSLLLGGDATASRSPTVPAGAAPGVFAGSGRLLVTSLLWSASIGVVAAVLGWPIGRALSRGLPVGRSRLLAVVASLPVALPAYLVFWTLWQGTAPGTTLGGWAFRAGLVPEFREAILFVGLVAWATPLAAWTIAALRWRGGNSDAALLAIDAPGPVRRLRVAFGSDRRGLLLAVIVAMLAVGGESVSFDLAQVRTYGYELRTIDATGGGSAAVLAAGWPAIASVAALLILGATLVGRAGPGGARSCDALRLPDRLAWCCAAGLVAPVALLAISLVRWGDPSRFLALYGRAAMSSLLVAAGAATICALLAAAVVVLRSSSSRAGRATSAAIGFLFLLSAAAPATVVAIALESGWNRPVVGPPVYDSPSIVLLALTARLGAVAILVAGLVSARSGRRRDLLALDAPRGVRAGIAALRPSLVAAVLASAAIGGALAWSEIAVTARLAPPGVELIATSLLNAVHYQQPETVVAAGLLAVLLAIAAIAIAVYLLAPRRTAVVLGAATILGGCGAHDGGMPEIPAKVTIGTAGFGPGQFHTPRAVAYDARSDRFYVVDKEARIQRFDGQGRYELEWRMPETANGRPVGISVHPDGRVFVADTHYYRVLVYDSQGRELARFGEYGTEPGRMIYPTDIAFGPDGRIYVGEYGGNDRVQVFSPEGGYLFGFGGFGLEEGRFSRPQTLVFDGDELLVADSNNHRIQIFDAEGRLLRVTGVPGREPGQLFYPRGIVPLGDGTAIVCEYGNHRVQRIDLRPGDAFGRSLGVWGGLPDVRPDARSDARPVAARSSRGRVQYPWDAAGRAGRVAVLDSGTDRLLIAPLPE